jgi:hypothetical protein
MTRRISTPAEPRREAISDPKDRESAYAQSDTLAKRPDEGIRLAYFATRVVSSVVPTVGEGGPCLVALVDERGERVGVTGCASEPAIGEVMASRWVVCSVTPITQVANVFRVVVLSADELVGARP